MRQIPAHFYSETFFEVFPGDGTGRDAHCRLASRGTPTAAIIANAILLLIGVIGMTGAKLVLDGAVVLGALVLVFHNEANWRAGRFALEHA